MPWLCLQLRAILLAALGGGAGGQAFPPTTSCRTLPVELGPSGRLPNVLAVTAPELLPSPRLKAGEGLRPLTRVNAADWPAQLALSSVSSMPQLLADASQLAAPWAAASCFRWACCCCL